MDESGHLLVDGTGPANGLVLGLVLLGIAFQAGGSVLVAMCDAGGLTLSFWRFTVSVPVLLVAVARAGSVGRGAVGGRAFGRSALRWAAVGGLAFAVHQVSFLLAVQATSVVDVALMQVLQPLMVGLVAAPLFGDRITAGFRWWSLVGMGGAALVVLDGSGGPGGDPAGMALAVASVVFFVVFFLISKRARPLMPVSSFLLVVTVVAGTFVGVVAWATRTPVLTISAHDLLLVIGFSLLGGIAGHALVTWSLRYLPVSLPPVLQLTFPFIAGTLAWIVLGQPVSTAHLAGGALIVVGVFGAVRSAPSAQGQPAPGTATSVA